MDVKGLISSQLKDCCVRFTWPINNFPHLNVKKLYSNIFSVGNHRWRILLFPKGNNVDHLSVYLEVANSKDLPSGWTKYAQISLSVINQIRTEDTIKIDVEHEFTALESIWGFTELAPLNELSDASRGFLVGNTIIVETEVKLKEKPTNGDPCKIIKVVREEDLKEQIGRNLYFDLVDDDRVRSFSIQKHMLFFQFKEMIAKELGVPVEFQRFWLWVKRENHTFRPCRPLTALEEVRQVGRFQEASKELTVFLEVERGPDLRPVLPPKKTNEEILLFFKHYDPLTEKLRYVGRLFVKRSGNPAEILAKLNEMAGFHVNEEIELFEEIKFKHDLICEHVDKEASFRASRIEDGDIICFQKSLVGITEQYRYPDVPSFLEYVRNHQVVFFRSLEKPKEDVFSLLLSKLHTYDDVIKKVAQHLGLDDPLKIRLTSHNCDTQQPQTHNIKYHKVNYLPEMLGHNYKSSDILYYELLDIPLPELELLKTMVVSFRNSAKDKVKFLKIRLPKTSTIGHLIDDLKTKVELSHPKAEVRLLEIFYNKIYKILPLDEKIENINELYWTLCAEEVPEEEKNMGPCDLLIHVCHFVTNSAQNQIQIQNFGHPFLLVIHDNETLAEVKARILKKLLVSEEEFAKWKFAFVKLGRSDYLQDTDIVATRFQGLDVYGVWERYLGLEHADDAPKLECSVNQENSVVLAHQESNPIDVQTGSSSEALVNRSSSPFAEFDNVFAGIQTLVEGKIPEAHTSKVAQAKKILRQCLDTKLFSVIQSGQSAALKNSLSAMLFNNAIPNDLVEEAKRFLVNLDRSSEQYVAAKLDWSSARESEESICELTSAVRQFSSEFVPLRIQAEAVDQEIEELEKRLSERKSKKQRLVKSLEDLAGRATASREALVGAERDMRVLMIKKERAEKIVGELESSWDSLKAGCSQMLS